MANICPTEVSSADEIAKSKPGQHKANTEVQGQNGALTTFQEVTNFVPGYANYNLNTSTAETKNPETSGIDNSTLDGLASYLLKHSLHMDFNINKKNFYWLIYNCCLILKSISSKWTELTDFWNLRQVFFQWFFITIDW